MSTPYTRGAALADRILGSDKGETGAIRRTTVTGGGPSDPAGGTTVESDYPCRLAAFPVAQRDIDGTLVKAGDFRVLVATGGLDITPTTTDLIVTSNGLLTIIDAGRFAPAGTVTHYKMIGRK